MNSPSDDGQYTDTDKEEGVIEDDKKSSGSNASFERPSVSGSSSDPSSRNVEIERNLKGHSSTSSSDAENEEARLRQKLLEKRSVLSSSAAATREVVEVERGTSSFVSVTITNVNRKLKTHSGSPKAKILLSRPTAVGTGTSDDEEMFSIQPKDSIVKQRSHSVRPHEYRERERVGHGDKMKKMERSREDKHRHKERKHDKHAHGDQAKRDYGSREARKRHISSKHQQVREHFPGRSLVVESKIAAKSTTIKASHKERESRCEPKVEQLPRIKDTSKSRSPHKRDINASPKRNIIMEIEVPAKKMHLERTDEIKMEVEETGVVDNESKIAETKISEAHVEMHNCKTKQNADADESHEDEPQISSQRTTPVGLSKYSKFDSDPDDQDEEGETEFSNSKIKAEMIMDSGSDAESDVILRGSDEDDVDLLDLNEEEMANLSPEARARVEEEQQKRLVAKLPVYYPGISGCRNVAEFECLNRIEEGTFGVVYRAKEKKTDEIVALKRLKMEKEKEGFPITSLREINMLLKAGNHPNIVNVREIVIGSNMDKIYLVMEYVEHDMKSLMDTMHARGKRFRPGEVKTLLHQLLCGVAHMHDEWILHRDLKTSNLLLSHKGILKIGDFGLSREFGDPLKPYTPIVVTLWYRAPELLLGVKEYSTAVDLWSCGCIFAEFLKLKPLFPGKGEMDQINKIFADLGSPNDTLWPGYSSLPGPRKTTFDHHEPGELERKFPTSLVDERGLEFLKELLTYDPNKRISAHEALTHDWFERYPLPTPPDMFPTWPAKSELGKSVVKSPITKPPSSKDVQNAKLYKELKVEPKKEAVTSFALKFDVAPKFSK